MKNRNEEDDFQMKQIKTNDPDACGVHRINNNRMTAKTNICSVMP